MATRVPLLPETRKLQLVGGSTLSVSVPKAWAEQAGLKPGDRILLEPLPCGALRIGAVQSAPARAGTRQVLDVTSLTAKQVEQRVIALYLSGRDYVEVTARGAVPPGTLTMLETLPRRINGLEIVEQRADRVVLHDMIDPSDFKPQQAFDRHYGLASRMQRDILSGVAQGDPDLCDAALLRKQDIDRLGWTTSKQHRLLLQRAYDGLASDLPPHHVLIFASATNLIQRLGRQGAQLAQASRDLLAANIDDQTRSGLVEVGTRALTICDEAARALHGAELETADAALSKLAPLEARLRELQSTAAGASLTLRGCAPCLTSNRVMEWIHANALVGAQLAELAVQRACDQA